MKTMVPNNMDEIILRLADDIKVFNYDSDVSLFNGMSGRVLFFSTLYRYYKDEHFFTEAQKTLEDVIDIVSSKSLDTTLERGYAGIGWLLNYLREKDLISNFNDSILKWFDSVVYESIDNDFKANNFDFLHGAIGKGIYYLSRQPYEEFDPYLIKIANGILQLCEKDHLGARWKAKDLTYNLGFAHGLSSVVLFLSMVYERGILQEKIKDTLHEIVKWILWLKEWLSGRLLSSDGFFPHSPKQFVETRLYACSRLSWCNGDLPVSLALLKISKILEDDKIRKEALSIAYHTTHRKIDNAGLEKSQENVTDSAFCHGISGLICIYNELYIQSGMKIFKSTKDYWKKSLIESRKRHEDGSLAFQTCFLYNEKVVWQFSGGMLQGAVGTGLVLLSLKNDSLSPLDKLFLLN